MKIFLKKHFNFEFPKWSVVAVLFAFSILINGDYWEIRFDTFKVFRTEVVNEDEFLKDFLSSNFLIEKKSSAQPLIKIPFFSKHNYSSLFIQKKFIESEFRTINKTTLTFDKPNFISLKIKFSNRSDLPHPSIT